MEKGTCFPPPLSLSRTVFICMSLLPKKIAYNTSPLSFSLLLKTQRLAHLFYHKTANRM